MTAQSPASPAISPCASCRFLRRKCRPECVFAPHFPQGKTDDFARVHRTYGASNAARLLVSLAPGDRRAAVHSLVYEATARAIDPAGGCLRVVRWLRQQHRDILEELERARMELSAYEEIAAAWGVGDRPMLLPPWEGTADGDSSVGGGARIAGGGGLWEGTAGSCRN